MGVNGIWRKLRWSVEQRGWWGTLWVALRAAGRRDTAVPVQAHPFDLHHGTDTGGVIGGGRLATGSRNDAFITAYAGIAPSRLAGALKRWAEHLPGAERVEDFSFVDLGCGKGRALLLASEWPFRTVTGVELNPGLVAVAKANVEIFAVSRGASTRAEVQGGDAAEIVYPAGPLLVFLYNPFGPPVVRAVLEALGRHVGATGARVDVLYQNESAETPTRDEARLQLVWRGQLPMSEEDAAAEPVGSAEDVTSLYRWVG